MVIKLFLLKNLLKIALQYLFKVVKLFNTVFTLILTLVYTYFKGIGCGLTFSIIKIIISPYLKTESIFCKILYIEQKRLIFEI